MTGLTVLCVDPDDGERRKTVAALTNGDDVTVLEHDTLAAAEAALTDAAPDCVVTEYELPDGTGLDLTARLREHAPDTPCILFTNADPDRIRTAQHGEVVVEYLPKDMPGARESLVRLVGNVVTQRTQVGYPLPPEEDERLAALEQYDRPGMDAVSAFDRLTALTKSHFGVDVAFVGLVDAHEERFLSCAGADWETLEREDTMCTHTILQDDLMVVEDTHEDGRFADSDRLDELDIRAYAGVPLETPRGTAIGAYCMTNSEPRSFSDAERADLRLFADEAMEQLELRRQLNECEGDTERRPGPDPDAAAPDGSESP